MCKKFCILSYSFISKLKLSFYTASGRSGYFQFLFSFSSAFLIFKMKSLLFSLQTKICKILHVILESTSQFSFKLCVNLHCDQTKLLYTFLAQTLFTLVKSSLLKCNFLRFSIAQVKIVKSLTSILNWQVNSSSNFASFFIVMTHNSPVNKLMHFLLRIKGSHQSPNF